MFDSHSSLLDASNEWKEKAEEALRATMAELSRKSTQRKPRPSGIATTFTPPPAPSEAALRQQWAKTQIQDINATTKTEMASLDALRGKQQEAYERQIAEKNEVWEKLVLQRREEAAELRSILSGLASALSTAQNQAKYDIEEAERRASESGETLREQCDQHVQQIGELTKTLESERKAFDIELAQKRSTYSASLEEKQAQIYRLQHTLEVLNGQLAEKDAQCEANLKQYVRNIRELREKLQQAREEENLRQAELMNMKKLCASLSKKISARKDEAASLKRQFTMLLRDNDEMQGDIVKMEKTMFPTAFYHPKL